MKVFNLNSDPEWDRTEDREGWRIKDAWVGAHPFRHPRDTRRTFVAYNVNIDGDVRPGAY